MIDVSQTIVAKSDQLNADDLVGGPITVTILSVTVNSSPLAEQPVIIGIDGGHQPWKPSKTMRRVLAFAWGTDASLWIGRSVRLVRNPDVKWAGKPVGGIEIAAMSGIKQRVKITLAESKKTKADHVIEVLSAPSHMSDADLSRACAGAVKRGWTREQVTALLGGRRVSDVQSDERRDIAARLAGDAPTSAEMDPEEMAAIIAAEKEEQGQ